MPESPAAAQTMQAHPGASLLDRLPCAVLPFIISKQLRAPTALADMMPCLSRHPRITQALERRISIADRTRAAAKMTCTASPRNLAVANHLCTISGHWPCRGSIATGVAQTSQRSKESPLPTSQPNSVPCERNLTMHSTTARSGTQPIPFLPAFLRLHAGVQKCGMRVTVCLCKGEVSESARSVKESG